MSKYCHVCHEFGQAWSWWLDFRLELIFADDFAGPKNIAHFKSGQK